MNYYRMIKQHVDTRADITIGAIEVPIEEASRYGIMRIDKSGRVQELCRKACESQPLS